MRLFEGVLIFVHIAWLFSFSLRADAKIKISANIAAFALLTLHLAAEGYRWQMAVTYTLFVVLTVVTFMLKFRRKDKTENRKKRKAQKLLYALLLILYAFGSVALATLIPVFQLPKPTGSFEVGMSSRHLLEESRTNAALPERVGKELMIQIWYPAEINDDIQPIRYQSFPYAEWAGTMEFLFSTPRFFFDYLKYGRTNSIQDIAVSNQQDRYPILLFSHGFGSTRMQSFSQMEELASHGYIVVSVDHMIDAAFTQFPDGREVLSKADAYSYSFTIEDERNVRARSEDMTFVLDQLTVLNEWDPEGLFTGKLDMERIGIFGHSYGGSTAAQSLLNDARILAGVNIDGPLHEPVASKGLDRPFMFILNKDYLDLDDEEIKYTSITPEQFRQYHSQIKKLADYHFREGIRADTYQLIFNAGDHYSFSDFPFLSPLLSKGIDIEEFHQVMNRYIVAYFNHYVMNEELDPLLLKEEHVNQFYDYEANRKRN